MSISPSQGSTDHLPINVPSVGASTPIRAESLQIAAFSRAASARFSDRQFFSIEMDLLNSESIRKVLNPDHSESIDRVAYQSESIETNLLRRIRASDIFFECARSAEIVDFQGNLLRRGLPERDLILGTFAALLNYGKPDGLSAQFFAHGDDTIFRLFQMELEDVLRIHGFTLNQVDRVLSNRSSLGEVVEVVANQLATLFLDCSAAGMAEDDLQRVQRATQEICKDAVFVLPQGYSSPDRIDGAQVGVNARVRGSIDQIRGLRDYLAENSVSRAVKIDPRFEPIFVVRASEFKDGKDCVLLQSARTLRQFALQAMNPRDCAPVVSDECVLVGGTTVNSVTQSFKIYCGDGKLVPYNFNRSIDQNQAILFIAIAHPASDHAADSKRQIARGRLLEAFAPYLKADVDTNVAMLGVAHLHGH